MEEYFVPVLPGAEGLFGSPLDGTCTIEVPAHSHERILLPFSGQLSKCSNNTHQEQCRYLPFHRADLMVAFFYALDQQPPFFEVYCLIYEQRDRQKYNSYFTSNFISTDIEGVRP